MQPLNKWDARDANDLLTWLSLHISESAAPRAAQKYEVKASKNTEPG